MIGTMVVCLSCRKMIWAYDTIDADIRGILNMMNMPCRLCGVKGTFDGYRVSAKQAMKMHMGRPDVWATMRLIAEQEGFEWAISKSCEWFDGPKWANMRDAGWQEAGIRTIRP